MVARYAAGWACAGGGASGTGKSVFLRTLITSLAQTHTPAQLHLYLIDFGGQAFRVFEKLPHVGGVFGEADGEYIRRLIAQAAWYHRGA